MRRFWSSKLLATGLALGGVWVLDVSPARAQFPIFYGGEVLTPFGQRGSDGSYLTKSARRLNTQANRAPQTTYVAPQPRVAPNPATTASGYSTPYYNNGVVYRRRFLGGWR